MELSSLQGKYDWHRMQIKPDWIQNWVNKKTPIRLINVGKSDLKLVQPRKTHCQATPRHEQPWPLVKWVSERLNVWPHPQWRQFGEDESLTAMEWMTGEVEPQQQAFWLVCQQKGAAKNPTGCFWGDWLDWHSYELNPIAVASGLVEVLPSILYHRDRKVTWRTPNSGQSPFCLLRNSHLVNSPYFFRHESCYHVSYVSYNPRQSKTLKRPNNWERCKYNVWQTSLAFTLAANSMDWSPSQWILLRISGAWIL